MCLPLKLRLYEAWVVSTLSYGHEAWPLTPAVVRKLVNFNAKCLAIITGRSIRDESVQPSFQLVPRLRSRRLAWVGHVLRQQPGTLLREVMLQRCSEYLAVGQDYPAGFIMEDAPEHSSVQELAELAAFKEYWNIYVNCLLQP